MIKNVIFDFGQVLVHFDPHYMVTRYVTDEADVKLLETVIFDRLYWDKLDEGTITDEEVMNGVRSRIPERLHSVAHDIYYNWIYNIPEWEGMREVVCELKRRGYKLYLLSNICTYFAEHKDEIPMLKLLDGCVFSGCIRKVKPTREIFEHLCTTYGIEPGETVFVDDRKDNINGGEAFGIRGYLFDGDAMKLMRWFDDTK